MPYSVVRIPNSQYNVSYTVLTRGQYKLHVHINGREMNDSLFTVTGLASASHFLPLSYRLDAVASLHGRSPFWHYLLPFQLHDAEWCSPPICHLILRLCVPHKVEDLCGSFLLVKKYSAKVIIGMPNTSLLHS